MVYQPVVDLRDGDVVGYEALARFPNGRNPTYAFRSTNLEREAARLAVEGAADLPNHRYLAVNASPTAIYDGLADDLAQTVIPPDQLIVEITERASVDFRRLYRGLREFLRRGGRIAVDDVGVGWSGLLSLTQLAPSLIKLDRMFVAGITSNPVHRSVAAIVLAFARENRAVAVAEGLETGDEFLWLRELDYRYAQGFLLQPPSDGLPSAVDVAALERQTLIDEVMEATNGNHHDPPQRR